MRKCYMLNVTFRILLPLVFMLTGIASVKSQVTYTIGPAPADYQSFSAAITALKNAGPITQFLIFNVVPGYEPYN